MGWELKDTIRFTYPTKVFIRFGLVSKSTVPYWRRNVPGAWAPYEPVAKGVRYIEVMCGRHSVAKVYEGEVEANRLEVWANTDTFEKKVVAYAQ